MLWGELESNQRHIGFGSSFIMNLCALYHNDCPTQPTALPTELSPLGGEGWIRTSDTGSGVSTFNQLLYQLSYLSIVLGGTNTIFLFSKMSKNTLMSLGERWESNPHGEYLRGHNPSRFQLRTTITIYFKELI